MTVFGTYAAWYDLFYADKDYRSEAAFVNGVLASAGLPRGELLEVGSGTGAHARWLVEAGWKIVGIDRSADMLDQARRRVPASAAFVVADARSFDLRRSFDAAVSLFHVMSYQAGPGELCAALRAIGRHLMPGGLFLFDFWYGPAVLAQKPEPRTRVVEDDRFHVVRTATPTLREESHVVEVAYHFEVLDKHHGERRTFDEKHPMRYLMPAEMPALARSTGFAPIALRAWLCDEAPSDDTWSAFALWQREE